MNDMKGDSNTMENLSTGEIVMLISVGLAVLTSFVAFR